MKEIKRAIELATPITYTDGATKKLITISRLEIKMQKPKKLCRLGPATETVTYYSRLLSLMTGLPIEAIEKIDAADLSTTMDAVYETLRSYQARRGDFLPPMPRGAG
jgi:hypothetical protein